MLHFHVLLVLIMLLRARHRQSLYDNEQGIQDRFALFWEEVAKHFAGNPYVLGGCLDACSTLR